MPLVQATSYIIPYRASDDPARRANLETVLGWLRSQGLAEIILVEQDRAPTLGDLAPIPGLRVTFTYSPEPFNKSWAMNVGVRLSRGSLLVFGDADVLSRGLAKAVAGARQGVPAVRPCAVFRDLDEADSAMLRGDLSCLSDPSFAVGAADRRAAGENPPLCGGIVVFQRQIYNLVGGWDERFQGWGGEDDAMDFKLQRAGIRPGVVGDSQGLHLHHRRHATSPGRARLYGNNLALLQQLRATPDEALRRQCEVTLQIIGNPDMYRPLEPLE